MFVIKPATFKHDRLVEFELQVYIHINYPADSPSKTSATFVINIK